MNSTSRGSSEVRIAARSPLRSIAGPATVRMPTPSSSRTMYASDRLAEPGRADEQDVVERLAARDRRGQRDLELRLQPLLADELGQVPRPQRAVELVLLALRAQARGSWRLRHAAFLQRLAHALLGRRAPDRPRRGRARPRRPCSRARRARRGQRAPSEPATAASSTASAIFSLQLEHDPLRRLLADPGDRLEPRRVLEHDRAAKLRHGRAGDDRDRHLRPDPVDREQVLEQLALRRRRRTRRAGARPRGRRGTSRSRPRRRARPAAARRRRRDEVADAVRRRGRGRPDAARPECPAGARSTSQPSAAAARARGRSRPRARRRRAS